VMEDREEAGGEQKKRVFELDSGEGWCDDERDLLS
jgi:hypothetical protein